MTVQKNMTDAKIYAVPCYGGGEGLRAPALAVFRIDRPAAERIIRLAQLVTANDIHKIERYDYRVAWLEHDPRVDPDTDEVTEIEPAALRWQDKDLMSSEDDCLNVFGRSFLFSCDRRSCDDRVETAEQDIAELALHFGLPWDFGGPAGYLRVRFANGEDPQFPASDWRYETSNGDTRLGYWDWLAGRYEAMGLALPAGAIGPAEQAADWTERLKGHGVDSQALAAAVRDLKGAEAEQIIAAGLAAEVRYLVEAGCGAAVETIVNSYA